VDDDLTTLAHLNREDEQWVEAPTSLVVASTLSAFAQLLKTIFMLLIDLGALAATIYLAIAGHWVAFAVMIAVGITLVTMLADIISGIVIAPFVLAEEWMGRRAERTMNERGRFNVVAAPAVEPLTSAVPKRRRGWRGVARVVALVLFIVVGAVVAAGRPANGLYYHSWSDWTSALIQGAIVSLFYLMVIGSIGYAIGRWRRRGVPQLIERRWRETVFGRSAMIVTLVLLVVSAAGRAASHQEAVQKATPNSNGTAIQQEKANLDAREWASSRKPIYTGYAATVKDNAAFVKALGTHGNTPAVRAMALRIQQKLTALHARLDILRAPPLAGLQALDAKLRKILSLTASGYSDYVAGLKANLASGIPLNKDKGALALLDSGDAKLNRAQRIVRALAAQAAALDKQYGVG
jgi:hypothetical protein